MAHLMATATLLAISGAAVVFGGTTTSAAQDPIGTCVSQYASDDRGLHKGQSRKTSGSVVAVGGPGLTISRVAVTAGGTREVQVSTGDDSDTEAMAAAYAAEGRSVLDDARAAGVGKGMIRKLCEKTLANGELSLVSTSGSGKIINSLCVSDTSGDVAWDGCVTRYRATDDGDPNWNYGIDDAQAWGHETNWEPWLDLHKGGVRNNYNTSRVDIIKASPSSDINDVDRCYSSSFGVSAAGFGVSSGGTVCPARWNITRTTSASIPEFHKVQWEGETNDDREAVAVSAYRFKPGYSNKYSLIINWDVH